MPLQDEDFIQIPLHYLVEIICHTPPHHLWEQPIRSRLPNLPDFTPRIVRYDLGALLKAKDPDEALVKVFLYPDSHHAEVWSKFEWDESNTKYFKSRQESEEYQAAEAERLRKWKGISDFVAETMGIAADNSVHHKMVSALLSLKSIPEQLKSFHGITDVLKQYGNLA